MDSEIILWSSHSVVIDGANETGATAGQGTACNMESRAGFQHSASDRIGKSHLRDCRAMAAAKKNPCFVSISYGRKPGRRGVAHTGTLRRHEPALTPVSSC
jgi:hypothetical protein